MRKKIVIRFIIPSVLILAVLIGAARMVDKWGERKTEKSSSDEYETINVMDEASAGIMTDEDPWKTLEQLVKAYYGSGELINYQGKMKLIDENEEKSKVLEELSFDYSLYKGQYHYKISSLECISKKKFIMMVNHEDKTIAISSTLHSNDNENTVFNLSEFTKLLNERSAEAKVKQLGAEKILTINNIMDPAIQGYQIYYDPSTYRVKKILIGMIRLSPLESDHQVLSSLLNSQSNSSETSDDTAAIDIEIEGYSYYLELNFDRVIVKQITEKDFQPEAKFIRFKNNQPELVSEYSEYLLLN